MVSVANATVHVVVSDRTGIAEGEGQREGVEFEFVDGNEFEREDAPSAIGEVSRHVGRPADDGTALGREGVRSLGAT
jgi:hypothetical protein